MRTAVISVIALLLLLCSTAVGVDPPVKLWEKWYYTQWDVAYFRDIELTADNEYFVTCLVYDYTSPTHENYEALLLDEDGNTIWEIPHEFNAATGVDGIVLNDGSFVVTGSAVDSSGSCTQGLYIHKISPEGTTIWAKLYDYPDTKESGYSITCLPDGGFAVCGRVHGTGQWAGLAWLLRTDADGDTLWTREWGTSIENYGKEVLYNNGELAILTRGTDDTLTTQGVHLLFYDLEGNYLRGTDYPALYYHYPADMCLASDGGYTFTTKTFPPIWHTDQYGETLWWKSIYVTPNDEHEAFCIRQTYDSGYIFSGWDGYFGGPWDEESLETEFPFVNPSPENTVDYQEGWLVRFDSDGNELWNINNTVSVTDHFYSCLQLPQGGYMACGTWGGSGYLVRYAPETGIEEPVAASAVIINLSPNPFSSSLSVTFSLPESMEASLTVFDLNGRIVGEVTDGLYPQGSSTIEWIPPSDLGTGCYLVRLNTAGVNVARNCVLIR